MPPISNVFNRDCIEAMAEFPDKYFDLAIVDPPYGIGRDGHESTTSKHGGRKAHAFKGWDNQRPSADYFNELFRVSKNQIIWGANYFTEFLPASMGWILWDKGQRICNSDGELAFSSFNRALRVVEYNRVQLLLEGTIHPTQKPIALYKWLLTNYAKPGDKILDTHLGSGSSRIASWDMGFDFWGYEIDADYFNDHEKRFKNHISKPVLFAPEQMYNFEQKRLFENA
jgi:site-specific DNA-methyltransferase (adenine-specific)